MSSASPYLPAHPHPVGRALQAHANPDQSQFSRLLRYIELNPTRATMVAHAADHPWSNCRAHAQGEHNTLPTSSALYPKRGAAPEVRQKAYPQLLRTLLAKAELEAIRNATQGLRAVRGVSATQWGRCYRGVPPLCPEGGRGGWRNRRRPRLHGLCLVNKRAESLSARTMLRGQRV